jgi:hypothetical protein
MARGAGYAHTKEQSAKKFSSGSRGSGERPFFAIFTRERTVRIRPATSVYAPASVIWIDPSVFRQRSRLWAAPLACEFAMRIA